MSITEASDAPALREELRALTAAARASIEWFEACGGEDVPVEGDPAAVLAMLDPARSAGRAGSPARARPVAPAGSAAPSTPRPTPIAASPAAATAPAAPPPRPIEPRVADLDDGERRKRLAVIAETVQGCARCGLHAGRKQTVFARGNPSAQICFVGEGPGADEDAQGLPFVGKAGQLLDKMITAMGLSQEDVYIANVVKCRPPNNRTPEASEMASCLPYLDEQLDIVRPRVIVALGATAVRGLLGPVEGITKIRGTWRLYRASIPLMPTFHPAYVLRQPTKEIRGMVWSDLQQVLKEVGRAVPGRAG